MKAIVTGARSVGPYLLLELFMPGGTLLALLLWWQRRRKAAALLSPSGPPAGA